MMADTKGVLGGVALLLVILIVGAVFGRLHGAENTQVKALGDRVACGLLSVPLISVAVILAFPALNIAWAIVAPAPMLLYTGLLAGVDANCQFAIKHFTAALFIGSLAIYLAMAVLALFTHA